MDETSAASTCPEGDASSHRGLRLQPHDELVALWVNELLAEPQEGQRCNRDDQGEVEASQGEHQALTQGRGHRLLAHQSPLAPPAVLLLVLHGGAGGEVTLQEGLAVGGRTDGG